MGTPGVKTNIKKETLVEAIKKRKGVATHVEADLNICPSTFYKLVDQYQLKDFLTQERNAFAENMCDIAENVLVKGMTQELDIPSAIGAAKYVLNNKGRERGYYPPVAPSEKSAPNHALLTELLVGIKNIPEEQLLNIKRQLSGETPKDESSI